MFKRVDLLVIKTFLGPFIATFFIVIFVFIMQFFFVYIDDFVGKGLEWFIIAELVTYLSANTIPLSLPLAILLSSIMTFGNLGERNELTALKSAGIPLVRFMMGLIAFIIILGGASLAFNNYVLPNANLKFYTTLFDITHQKPALNIKEDVFYKEIEGYVIKIDRKDADNRHIYGIYIREKKNDYREQSVIIAERGEMFADEKQRFLVLHLYNGAKYQLLPPDDKKKNVDLHLRTYFQEMDKVFDLSAFQLTRSNEDLYKDHYVMLNIRQLRYYIDSLESQNESQVNAFRTGVKQYFRFLKDSAMAVDFPDATRGDDHVSAGLGEAIGFTGRGQQEMLGAYDEATRSHIVSRAISRAKLIKAQVESPYLHRFESGRKLGIKASIELHKKYNMAIACLVLLLIGAPFGAIVRKGGIGLPVVASTVLYMAYLILFKFGENFARKELISVFWGLWAPNMLMFPIGVMLIRSATIDSSLMMKESYFRAFEKLRKFFRPKG